MFPPFLPYGDNDKYNFRLFFKLPLSQIKESKIQKNG